MWRLFTIVVIACAVAPSVGAGDHVLDDALTKLGEAGAQSQDSEDLAPVTGNIACYKKVLAARDQEHTRYRNAIDEAKVAQIRKEHTTGVKKASLTRMKTLQADVVRDRAAMNEWKKKYKKDHLGALHVYELARRALNRYNDARKSANVDDTQSQEAMTAYLKYKDLVLKAKDKAKADGKPPEKSADYKQYSKMTARYLKTYQTLQAKSKLKLTTSQKQSNRYRTLSKQYKKLGADLKLVDASLNKATKVYSKSNDKFKVVRAKYKHAVETAEKADSDLDRLANEEKNHKEKYLGLKKEEHRLHVKWDKLNRKAKKLTALKANALNKLSRYRTMAFKFSSKAKKRNQLALEQMKLKNAFHEKFMVADAAQHAFSEAFVTGGCGMMPHQIEAQKARQAALRKQRQAVAAAVRAASEELQAAKEMRNEPMKNKKAAGTATRSNLRESAETAPSSTPLYPAITVAPLKEEQGSTGSYTIPNGRALLAVKASKEASAKHKKKLQDPFGQQGKTECVWDQEVGTTNFNAAENSKMIMERHAKAENAHRKEAAKMMSGANSARQVITSMKSQASGYSVAEDRALTLRNQIGSKPCGPLSMEEEWEKDN